MQTLQDSIKYTLEKKEYQLLELKSHYTDSIKDIEDYVDGRAGAAGLNLGAEYLSYWYIWNYNLKFIQIQKIDLQDLAYSTINGFEANNIKYFFGKRSEKYKSSVSFSKAIKDLAQMFLLGWDDLAVKYGHLLIKMLYGKQYKGWHSVYKHPWFMLEIFCQWQGIKLEYDKLNYPEDMGVYQRALEHWNTKDTALLSKLVNEMVNFHIAQSDEYVKTDENGDESSTDFPSSDYFIYAIEILLWLNIRNRMGLPDYIPDNELMKMPINNWHTHKTDIPKIELIEQAKAKLLQDYPDIKFEITI